MEFFGLENHKVFFLIFNLFFIFWKKFYIIQTLYIVYIINVLRSSQDVWSYLVRHLHMVPIVIAFPLQFCNRRSFFHTKKAQIWQVNIFLFGLKIRQFWKVSKIVCTRPWTPCPWLDRQNMQMYFYQSVYLISTHCNFYWRFEFARA